jgi:hypothetical protein
MKYEMTKGNFTIRLRDGRRMKKGDTFEGELTLIPGALRGYFSAVTSTAKAVIDCKPKYRMVSIGRGWYNILNNYSQRVNEKALRKADAEQKVKELNEL